MKNFLQQLFTTYQSSSSAKSLVFCVPVNLHGNLRGPPNATFPLRNSRPYYRFITHDDPLRRLTITWGDGNGMGGAPFDFP